MKILFIRKKFFHHTKHSGYDIIFDVLDKTDKNNSIFIENYEKYLRGIGQLISLLTYRIRKKNKHYTNYSFLCEIHILIKNIVKRYDVIHYTYAEPHLYLSNRFKFLLGNTKLITTVHLPDIMWNNSNYNIKNIVNCDKIIFLDNNSMEKFNLTEPSKKVFIPHPVDTSFFNINQSKKNNSKKLEILFCGNYLRDFELLKRVIEISDERLIFNVVVSKAGLKNPFYNSINNNNNCTLHYNVTDKELIKIYQYCDLLFMPVIESTANNVVLEAMSCGLPIAFTSKGIMSYVKDEFSYDLNNSYSNISTNS
jgi:glycosyltransferase involved in cell wall biosynthesis